MMSKNYISRIVLCAIFSFSHFSCNVDEPIIEDPFNVKVISSDYSLAYSTIYELDKDTIRITYSGHVEGEVDTVFYRRPLSIEEKKKLAAFFSEFPLSDIKSEYITPNVDDGDQKLFVITIGEINKTIRTSNYFEAHLGNMVKFLNGFIDDKYKICYEPFNQME